MGENEISKNVTDIQTLHHYIYIVIIINIIINIIIIIPTTIQQWLSITQDTAIPYRGSQERALPQHGFRAGHTYQQFIEDPLECYERYERMIHYIEDQ